MGSAVDFLVVSRRAGEGLGVGFGSYSRICVVCFGFEGLSACVH